MFRKMAGRVGLQISLILVLYSSLSAAQGYTISTGGPEPPNLALVSKNLYVPYGTTVSMSCVALDSDDDGDLPGITWWLDGTELRNGLLDDFTIDTRLATQNSLVFVVSILKVCSIEEDDVGEISCTASSNGGNITASWNLEAYTDPEETITITENGATPVVVIVPGGTCVVYNNTVAMTCVAYGLPPPTITWSRFDGLPLNNGTSRLSVFEEMVVIDGQMYVESTLEICGVGANDFGDYSCVASNPAGNGTQTFTFSCPEVVLAPNNLYASAGSDVTMTCVARGVPAAPDISWSVNGDYLDETNDSVTIDTRVVQQEDEEFTVSLLRVCGVETDLTGEYSCVARANSTNTDTLSWTVTGTIPVNVSTSGTSPRVVLTPDTASQLSFNSTVIVTCIAYGDPVPVITWSRDNMELNNMTDGVAIYSTTVSEGGRLFTQSIMKVCFVDADDTGVYSCTATNSLGTDVQDIDFSYTEIVGIPNDIRADYGSTITMSCIAVGNPLPEITWSKDGWPLSDTGNSVSISNRMLTEGGQTFSVSLLTVCNAAIENIGQYSCEAINAAGATDSQSWQVDVFYQQPTIVVGPPNTLVQVDNTVILTCVAYGVPLPSLTWTRGGEVLDNTTSSSVSVYPLSYSVSDTSVVEARIQICNFALDDITEYGCIAESPVGEHVSRFNVDLDPIRTEVEVAVITKSPTVRQSTSTILSCVAYSFPGPPTVYWMKDGVDIMNSSELVYYEQQLFEGGQEFVYSAIELCTVGMEDAGNYTCVADNGYRTESLDTQLTVVDGDAPSIVVRPNSTTYTAQERTITLTCVGYGIPLPESVQWYRDGVLVTPTPDHNITQERVVIDGNYFIRSFLQICDVDAPDEGNYSCAVDNGFGRDSSGNFSVEIAFTEVVVSPPPVADVLEANTYQFTCVAYGQPMPDTFTWYYSTQPAGSSRLINGSLDNRVTISQPELVQQDGRVFVVSVLRLCDVRVTDVGTFSCEAAHDVHIDSQSFQLNVIQPGFGPEIVIQPTNYTFANDTTTYSFVCVATGDQVPSISWSFGSQQLSNDRQHTIYEERVTEGNFTFTRSVLQICNILYNNRGIYTCTARNQRATVDSATFEIDVDGALSNVVAVEDKIESLSLRDARLEFEATFADPPPTDMRWYFTPEFGPNPGVEILITSASNSRYTFSSDQLSLSISSLSILDQGRYRLAVENLVGIQNGFVHLSVYVEPQITTTGRSTTGTTGGSVSLTCSADGVPTPSISWLKGGQLILPNEGDKYSTTEALTTPGQRLYIPETRTSTLTISRLIPSDAGTFTCLASNDIGKNALQSQPYQLQVQSTMDFCADPTPCMNGGTCTSASMSYTCQCPDGYNGGNCENSVPNIDINPMITQRPQTTFVNHYDSVNLTCLVSGVPQPTVQWYKDGQPLPGENLQYLFIGSVDVWARGVYNCTASSRAGTYSDTAVVNVNDMAQYNIDVTVPRTSSIFNGVSDIDMALTQFVNDLSAQVVGTLLDFNNGASHVVLSAISLPQGSTNNYNPTNGALRVQVSYIIVDSTASFDKTSIGTESLGQLRDLLIPAAQTLGVTMTLPGVVVRFDGCLAGTTPFTSPSGSVSTISWPEIDVGTMTQATCPCVDVGCSNSAPRTVVRWCQGDFIAGGMWADPSISDCMYVIGTISSLDGGQVAVQTGSSITVSFSISGSYPSITSEEIAWMFTNLDGQTTSVSPSSKYVTSADRLRLTITNAMIEDAGTYTITASSVAGSASSSVAVTVVVVPSVQGMGGTSFTQDSGTRAQFMCRADGIPTPSILWLKNGQLLQTGFSERFILQENVAPTGQERPSITESRTSTLIIQDVTPRDDGSYRCQAVNQYGNSATLSQPYNLTVTPPDPENYCEGVTCLNGGSCTSGRSSYTCSCTSGFNGVNCENIVETLSAPSFIQGPQDTVVNFHESVTLVCMVTGYPQPTTQWFKDRQLIDRENSQVFTIESTDLPDRGLYSCTATNSQGSISSEEAVVNIRGVQQYLMTVNVPATSQPFTGVDLAQSSQLREAELLFLLELNERVAGVSVGGGDQGATIQISSIQNQQIIVTSYDAATNQLQVTLLLTLFASGYDNSQGGSPVTSDTLTEVTERLSNAAMDVGTVGVMIPASEIQRFDGCSVQSETFFSGGQSRGILIWPETSIGETALAPCPCEQQSLQKLGATRKCSGDFIRGGMWASFDPIQAPCNQFSDLTWMLCSTADIGGVFSLTQDASRIGSLEVALTTEIVEQMVSDANGDRTASATLLSIIDNVLKAPKRELMNGHEIYNTSGRLMAALNQLSDSIPILSNPDIIVLDTYAIIIYSNVNPDSFSGHTVAALLGGSFVFDTFNTEDINVAGGGYSETPTVEIRTPGSLFNKLNVTAPTKMVYNVFLNDSLFLRRNAYLDSVANSSLGSIVVAARIVGDIKAADLEDQVWMSFLKNQSAVSNRKTKCTFWDQQKDDGYGAWSTEGCSVVRERTDQTTCQCNHLTSFALIENGTASDPTIGPYTVFGIAVLFICALLVLISYIVSSHRSTSIGVFLINLCIGLLLLCLSYVISEFLRAHVDPNACYAFSAFFHYMILVDALAILMMAVFMVYTPYTSRMKKIGYLLAIIINWILPLVIVVLSLAPNYENYYNDEFCRPVSLPYWVGLLLPGCVMGVITAGLLVVILIRKRGDAVTKYGEGDHVTWKREYFGLLLSAALYYLAWGFGLPQTNTLGLGALRIIFQLIFVVATGVLGLSLFLIFCFFSPEIRFSWRKIFCFCFDTSDKRDKKALIDPVNARTNSTPFEAEFENPVAEEDMAVGDQPLYEEEEEEEEKVDLQALAEDAN